MPNATENYPLLDIRNLYVEYLTPHGAAQAVNDVSFSIGQGEVFGLAGESGCGKSTIAHSILRVLRPPAVITGGHIFYKGSDLLELDEMEDIRWAEISMVFQSAMNSLNPVIKIVDQVTDVIIKHQKVSKKQALERAVELMEIVNIDKRRLDSYPHQLSGGMRQRAVIAIALALKPALMIMDEPTTALDVVVQKDILQQIEQLKEQLGFSILFITHDLSLMVEFSDRIAIMYAGDLVEMAPASEILNHPLHPYTQGLLTSFPAILGEKKKLSGIPGSPPNLIRPPTGCKFHPRCRLYDGKEPCVTPQFVEALPGHWVSCGCCDKNLDRC